MAADHGRFSPAETLHELFDRNGIELHEIPIAGRQHGGSRSKIYCPKCGGGREHERNFFVAIDRDAQGAAWHCFRANNCGWSGGGRLKGAPERPQHKPRHYRRPEPEPPRPLRERTIAYFEKFGISAATLERLGIYVTRRRMPVLDGEGKEIRDKRTLRDVLAYPYFEDGELLNVKFKALYPGNHKRFLQEYGCKPTLFNIDSFINDEWGIMVEGEDDVAAVYESGWHQVATLPDGSPTKVAEEFNRDTDDDQRYAPLYGEPRLDRLKKIYLAGDMDLAGRRHHEEMARRLGKGRCWEVRWPTGCKDAKETLEKRGIEAIHHAIERAIPYPLEGVYVVPDEDLANYRRGIRERRFITGYDTIDDRVSLNDEGQLIITTGISGRGKTTFWNAMAMLYTERNAEEMKADRLLRPFHTMICSVEMKPMIMQARLIAARAHLPFHDTAMQAGIALDQIENVYSPWIRQHFTFLKWPDRATQPTITWLLDRIREIVLRTGAKLVVVDPWQEFDDEWPDRDHNLSRWIGKQLQRFVALAAELGCNIVIVVHPTKMRPGKDGKVPVPEGDDIADSRMFFSHCDIGLTVHRANLQSDEMMIKTWKTKDTRFARWGDTVVRIDPHTHRIWPKPTLVQDELPRSWHD